MPCRHWVRAKRGNPGGLDTERRRPGLVRGPGSRAPGGREWGEDRFRRVLSIVERNVAVFRGNLAVFGVLDRVDIHVGKTDEVAPRLPRDRPVGLFFLDVDGHVDRDLGHFYNLLLPGARVIIDDYRDAVSSSGRKNIDAYRALSSEGREHFLQRQGDFGLPRLLGKHLLTARLIELFVHGGWLEATGIVGSTWHGRKSTSITGSLRPDEAGLRRVKSGILEEFLRAAN